jgi:hypothetical protein
MSDDPAVVWQPALWAMDEPPAVDATFAALQRIDLDPESWVDHAPRWVTGADPLFEEILRARPWAQRSRHIYDREVKEPRLTAPWSLGSGEPLRPPRLEEIRNLLGAPYGRSLDSVCFTNYLDVRGAVQ